MLRQAQTKQTQRPKSLDAGLAHSDLKVSLGASSDLSAVDLDRAARLLVLMSDERSPLYRRAATRWLSRYAAETPDLTPAMLAGATAALGELERGDLGAAERLREAVRRND